MVDSILQTALRGMARAMRDVSAHVEELSGSFRVDSPDFDKDPVPAMVNLKVDAFSYKANAKVVQVGRDMGKAVLDILA